MKINELTISHNEYLYAFLMVAMEFYSSFNPFLSFKTTNVNTIRKKCNDTNRGPLVFFRKTDSNATNLANKTSAIKRIAIRHNTLLL